MNPVPKIERTVFKFEKNHLRCESLYNKTSAPALRLNTTRIGNLNLVNENLNMKFPTPNLDPMLLIHLTALLVCGLYPTSSTAIPISSLSAADADSASFDLRTATMDNFPRRASAPRSLSKRGLATQAIVIIICVIVSIAGSIALSYCLYRYLAKRFSD